MIAINYDSGVEAEIRRRRPATIVRVRVPGVGCGVIQRRFAFAPSAVTVCRWRRPTGSLAQGVRPAASYLEVLQHTRHTSRGRLETPRATRHREWTVECRWGCEKCTCVIMIMLCSCNMQMCLVLYTWYQGFECVYYYNNW